MLDALIGFLVGFSVCWLYFGPAATAHRRARRMREIRSYEVVEALKRKSSDSS